MVYKEEKCPKTWIKPLQISCCTCGEFTGLVETYPDAFIFRIAPHCYICRLGYGCRKKCICENPEISEKPSSGSYSRDGRHKETYRCLGCKKISKIVESFQEQL